MPKAKPKAKAAPVEAAVPAVVETPAPPAPAVEQDARTALAIATGSDHPEVQRALVSDVIGALGLKPGTELHGQRSSAAFGLLAAFQARDAVEAMLGAQAIALNNAGMAALRRSASIDLPPEVASRLRRDATSMFRTSADLVQTIEGRRGNGAQRIVVEHVEKAIFTGPQGGGSHE